MRNLSLGRRHPVNAYEVEAGIGVIAGNTVWSIPERFECEVLQKARYINTLTFTFTFSAWMGDCFWTGKPPRRRTRHPHLYSAWAISLRE